MKPRSAALAVLALLQLSLALPRSVGGETISSSIKPEIEPEAVLSGLREFYRRTARPDGSFQPGIDPSYLGMSDCAYSDLAAVTYACTIHKTFGWQLPHEQETIDFLLSRQRPSGEFVNVAGTVDPQSPQGRTYNTTQALVALRALGVKPRHDPLPVFEEILRSDYKTLPAYSTSFFPLAYLCYGRPIPEQADRAIRALMVQDETGYLNDHIAATFHASHYYALVGETTPKSKQIVARVLRDQKADGSWMLNMPSRDRHATFDAVFTLRHEGFSRPDCQAAVLRAAAWALSCRNADGGFGHFPGSTSDADGVYFQVGTLVMAGILQPTRPLPPDPHLLSWGHLMPLREPVAGDPRSLPLPGWTNSVAFSPDGRTLAAGCSDHQAHLWDTQSGKPLGTLSGHADHVAAVAFSPDGNLLVTGSYDHSARIWNLASRQSSHVLTGHHGAVTAVAVSPTANVVATASLDQTIRTWNLDTGEEQRTLTGHKSWVNSIAYAPNGDWLVSGSSDGTVKLWSIMSGELVKTLAASQAEVRSVAVSPDGTHIAAGIRYGAAKVWSVDGWTERWSWETPVDDTWSVVFSHDNRRLYLAAGQWNRPAPIAARDLVTGAEVAQFRHAGEVLGMAISRDGRHLAASGGDRTVSVWRIMP